MVILQVLSLNFDKIVDKDLLTGLNLHIEKVQCDQSVIWSLASELFNLAKQVLIFEGEKKKNPEPKHSNSLLTNQRLNLYTPFAVVAFMSLWQTCLGGGKWLDIRKIMIETVKQTNKKDNYKFKDAITMHGLLRWLSGKESACHSGNVDSISGSRTSPGEGNGHPLQYSCLRNPMIGEPDGRQSMESQKSQTWLRDLTHTHVTMHAYTKEKIARLKIKTKSIIQ